MQHPHFIFCSLATSLLLHETFQHQTGSIKTVPGGGRKFKVNVTFREAAFSFFFFSVAYSTLYSLSCTRVFGQPFPPPEEAAPVSARACGFSTAASLSPSTQTLPLRPGEPRWITPLRGCFTSLLGAHVLLKTQYRWLRLPLRTSSLTFALGVMAGLCSPSSLLTD